MSLEVRLRRAAQNEHAAAADWYESQQSGLGAEFVGAVAVALNTIADHPMRYAEVWGDVREAPLARFPYCVYYRMRGARLIVIAVHHSARDPATWQGRG